MIINSLFMPVEGELQERSVLGKPPQYAFTVQDRVI